MPLACACSFASFCALDSTRLDQGGFTVPAYAAAKGALGQLTKALSNEWSKENVQVNGICPGYIATDMCVASLLLSRPPRSFPPAPWPSVVRDLGAHLLSGVPSYIFFFVLRSQTIPVGWSSTDIRTVACGTCRTGV
ncbi:hypothetical protein NUW54_g9129 [Trametes sanguinea]|uniref:Uncharacterized protein n=1 Tax=Trametes sanguinea TaxID=158606 RepID=A0ACC1P8B6_9APHY|nr:hypothetical protein NUW54_g9129 [Trametes sanguinea]